ncbi:MAG: SdrD B-like domain-containing protein [Rhodocyclaceae bacterium]
MARWGIAVGAVLTSVQGWASLRVAQLEPNPSTVSAGGLVTNTVRIADTDSLPVTTPGSFDFNIPANARYAGTGTIPTGTTCAGMAAGDAGPGTVTCSGITLAADQTLVFELLIRPINSGVITVTAHTPDAAGESKLITVNTGADLGIGINAATSVAAGSTQSVVFTVVNNGPDTSPSSTLTYSVPPGFKLSGTLPSGCAVSGATLNCTLSALASNATTTLTVAGTIGVGNGSTIAHTADIQAGGGVGDGVDTNNTATVSMTVTPGSSLALAKTQSATGNVTVGDAFNYILTPTYSGDFPSGAQIVDNIPANFSFNGSSLSFSSNGWTCTASSKDPNPAPTVSCTYNTSTGTAGYNLALGTITIPVKALTAGASVVNTATLSASGATSSAGSVTTVVIDPLSDFSASKKSNWLQQKVVPLNTQYTYTLAATNAGPSVFTGAVTLTDSFPASLQLNSIDTSSGLSCTVNGNPVTLGATLNLAGPLTIVCVRNVTALAVNGATTDIKVNVQATQEAATIDNSVCVTTATGPADPNGSNNCATLTLGSQSTTNQAKVSVIKRVVGAGESTSNRQIAGQSVVWEIEVVNAGPATANKVSVTDTLPNRVGTATVSVAAGAATMGSCAISGSALSGCTITTLPVCVAGSTCPVITITGKHYANGVSASDNTTSVTNSVSVLAETPADDTTSDNTATATAYLTAQADLAVTQAANPAPVPAGQLLTYTLTVSNPSATASSRAYTVSLTDTLPDNVVFLSATPGGSGTCTTKPAAGSVVASGNNQLVCNWSSIDRGAQQTVTVTVRPLAALMGSNITNTATVSTVTPELSTTNNTTTLSTLVKEPAYDLAVQNTDDVDPVNTGDDVTYTINVTNNAASTAENVRVTNVLPSGTGAPTFVEVVSVPTGVTYTTNGTSVGAAGGSIVFTIPALGGTGTGSTGETSSAQLKLKLRGVTRGSFITQTSVQLADATLAAYDPQSNNTVNESTYFRYKADVQMVSKQAMRSGTTTAQTRAAIGEVFDWLLTVRNNGPEPAETTTISDALPTGMAVAGTPVLTVVSGSFDPVAPTCTVSGSTVTCAITTMPVDGVATVRIPATFSGTPSNGTSFSNTASIVTTASGDTNGGGVPTAGNNFNSGSIVAQTSTISGRVFADTNANGTYNSGETGIATTITLNGVDDAGTAVTKTATSTGGTYSFSVPPGTYTLTETQPAAYAPGITRAGTVTGTGSVAGSVPTTGTNVTSGPNGSNANTIVDIVVGVGGTSVNNNFGEVKLASVAGRVYQDTDYSGSQGAAEPGIAAVRIDLSGTDMFGNAQTRDTTSATTTGAFSFTTLWPGSYTLTETQPGLYVDATDTAGSAGGSTAVDNIISGITLASDTQATGYYFGEQLTRIPVVVFEDANNDGVPQAGDAGITGVVLRLTGTDAGGNAVNILATAVSGQNGRYEFRNVPASNAAGYVITETQPTDYSPGKANANGNAGTVDVAGGGNIINAVVIPAGSAPVTTGDYYFGELTGGGISGRVYHDVDGNGSQGTGESGLSGVTVSLSGTGVNGNAVALTATTDATGGYSFGNVGPGTYTLTETQPAAYAPGITRAGTVSGTGSAAGSVPTTGTGVVSGANGSNANTIVGIVLGTGGASSTNNNFGEVVYATLAGRVYHDVDYSGGEGSTDPGIASVRVDVSGTDMFGNTVSRTTTSAVTTGAFSFDTLWPGSYTLAETQPAAFVEATDTAGSAGGSTAVHNSISGITLASNSQATGYYFGEQLTRIPVVVFEDANNDGTPQAGENGIGAVVLRLTGTDAGGNAVDILATAVSGQAGRYEFRNVPASSAAGYVITETQPAGYSPGKANANGNPGVVDAAGGGNVIRSVMIATGSAPVTTGDYYFGELTGGGVSGRVFFDRDGDGLQGSDEPGLAAVAIQLSGTGVNGNAVSLTASTDASGSYSFADVGPGTYTLSETQPAAYAPGITRAGTVTGSGSAAGSVPLTGTGVSSGPRGSNANSIAGIVLGAPGASSSGNNFGEVIYATLSGRVYHDIDYSGSEGSADPGIGSVRVDASGTDMFGNAVSRTATSAATTGAFSFDTLWPGSYTLTETQPSLYVDATDTAGNAGGSTAVHNSISGITLASNTQATGYYFGEQLTRIPVVVFEDANNDGVPQAGESGIGSVTLHLTGTDASGNAVDILATVVSGQAGRYEFRNVPASGAVGYVITETQPAGYSPGKANANGNPGVVDPAGGGNVIRSVVIPTGSAPVTTSDYYFGELTGGSVGGRVYFDRDGNGTQGTGEPGLSGVTVSLNGTGVNGNAVSLTAITDASGSYSFADVGPGTYTLSETQPAAYAPGITHAGTVTGTGSSVGSVPASGSGVTAGPRGSNANSIVGIVLGTPGSESTANNFGEVIYATVAGRVYHDIDYSGSESSTDPGIASVRVDASGTDMFGNTVSRTATSAATTGAFSFDTLWPGSYTLTETQPAAFVDATDTAGSAGGSATVDNTLSGITLVSNTQATGYYFGEQLTRIPVVVFEDANNDGVPQAGDTGIGSVVLHLTGVDAGGNAVDILATAVSGQAGRYEFRNVPASGATGYVITETQPAGYSPGKANANGNPGVVDAAGGGNVIRSVVIATGSAPVTTGDYYFGELTGGGVGGRVFYDRDGSGVQGSGEPGLVGVVITLTGTGVNGNTVSLTTTTDATGSYNFADVGPGTYVLTETRPTGYLPGLTHAGSVTGTGSTAGTVPTSGTGVTAGTRGSDANSIVSIVLGTPGAGSAGNTFSATKAASLAGSVYGDVAPANGVHDADEAGIAGVRIVVSGTDFYGNSVAHELTTDASGQYSAGDLLPGTYQIDETQPAGILDGPESLGTVSGAPRGTANPAATNDRFGNIVLAAEEAGVAYDFGERGGQLGGYVYVDSNKDGVRQVTEPGIPGVTLTLTGQTASGTAVSLTVQTDANGQYAFSGVLPANDAGYTVTETQPITYADGLDTAGQVAGVASGVAGNDVIRAIAYKGGDGDGYNFGELGASLSGLVYTDVNGNRVRELGDLPLAGVTLTLTGTDATGLAVTRTTLTLADGSYRFDDLPVPNASGFTLTETQPTGYDDVGATAGTLGGSVPNANQIVVAFTTAGGNGSGYDFFDRSNVPSSLSGTVWRDTDHDRLRDVDESTIAGWSVELLGCADGAATCVDGSRVLRNTTITTNDGDYRFENLVPGEYQVRFRTPAGLVIGGAWPTDPVMNSANGAYPTASGQTPRATIAARVGTAAQIINQDLPLDPGGIVYDSLSAEPIAGAVVTLNGPVGFDGATQLLGGSAQVTTGADGYYDFFLLSGAPAGTYTISITPPSGYGESLTYPASTGPLNTQSCSAPGGVVDSNTNAPCVVSSLNAPAPGVASAYYLSWQMPAGGGQHVVNNHIPLDPQGTGAVIDLRKTSSKLTVKKAELVPYVITARNTRAVAVGNVVITDTLPPGFKYVEGSLTLQNLPGGVIQTVTPTLNGRQITLPAQTFAANESKRITLVAGVGVGVGEGQYVNQVVANQGASGQQLSNIATAAVRVVADALFDCTDVIGKVFDDKNANGYQDEGEPGIPNVRVATVNGLLVTTDAEGRYHIACAAIPKEGTGSNFVLKLDERTLPSGYRVTTENPADERVTRGKAARINFGATVHRVVRFDLQAAAFDEGKTTLLPAYDKHIDTVIAALAERPSIVRLSYRGASEAASLADARIAALREALLTRWRRHCEAAGRPFFNLDIEVERSTEAQQ